MQKRLLVIDGNSLMHRAFYALPQLSNKDGILTNAVFGFMNMFLKLLDEHSPQYAAVAFDMKGPTFRHLEYVDYKATRQKSPEGLGHQFGLLIELLEAMPVAVYRHEGYEADDILGWLSKSAEDSGIGSLIVTGDKDALQLVSHDVSVLLTKRGISEVHSFNLDELKREYGLEPWQMIELKALMGDSSDNIPGVPGVGEKTALSLIHQYGSVQGVFDHIEEIKGVKLKENLYNNRESAFLSKKLATILRESPIPVNIEDCALKIRSSLELIQKLERLGFQSLIGKLIPSGNSITEVKASSIKENFIQIDTRESLSEIAEKLTESGSIALFTGDELTISSNGLPIYRIVLQVNDALDLLKPVLENEQIDKITFDAKALMHTCKEYGIDIKGIKFDTLIAAYLLNPAQSKYDLKQLVYDYLRQETENPDAEDVRLLADCLRDKLKEQDMLSLYADIEHPLIELLFFMENAGFRVDREMLENLGVEFSLAIERLTGEIYKMSHGEFNINSTKQLGEILFDKLKLPAVKKTKTGYSTDIEVLEELKGRHPIIEAIIDYRQIAKLKSTYIDGLVKMIDQDDGRIHSSFNQTVAVTGRISSTEPNLQNIPVRMEIGRRIRKIFIPSEAHVLVDADYSQIELRILAHMSQDTDFIESFLSGEDIHRKTASEMFGISMDKVTSEQRNSAKAVNFGIVYGISDFGLSQNLGISVSAAKGYIDRYFKRYKKVRLYLDGLVELAERQGYVATLMGRRRYIPEIKSRNKTIYSLGKRLAMNTPIQGTAADIIKVAMIDVYNELKRRSLKSKLILQVHDELIIDTDKDEIDEVKELLRDKMANAVKLAVPLSVEVGVGDNWYDAK
jgi:DNA polymerase-1